jgi:hypothetical protein
MKKTDIDGIAKQRGIKCGKMNKTDLVRTIQTAEGNNACFNTGQAQSCGQDQCLWRGDCQ